jgi:ATP-dependent RNA helicase DDX24/MAK5
MDIVGAAETGSGKTLAFGIPIVQGILQDKQREATGLEEEENVESGDGDNSEALPEDANTSPEAEEESADKKGTCTL